MHVATVEGETDLDLIMPSSDQIEWFSCPNVYYESNLSERIDLGDAHRDHYRHNYEKFVEHPESDSIVNILRVYARGCLPACHRTEFSFWAVSCTPSTNASTWPRLAVVNVNMMEVLVIGRHRSSTSRHWAFINVSQNSLWHFLRRREKLELTHRGIRLTASGYRAAGHDQICIECRSLIVLRRLIADPRIRHAAAALNLRLMRKGSTIYGKYHCPDLADRLFELD